MINKRFLMALLFNAVAITAFGQQNPMGSMYYQNQFLNNPAMAGQEKGVELNAGFKAQWTSIEGAPKVQALTATFGSESGKVGLGLSVYNEVSGLIQRTSGKGTFAYHLPLNDKNSYLDFGLSAGFLNEWVDFNKVNGSMSDISLNNFNKRKIYLDGDFGVAFRNEHITLQVALPNLKQFFDRDLQVAVIDRTLYFAAASYKFLGQGYGLTSIEPKVSYRGIQDYKGIFDMGINTVFYGNKLMFSGVYHSTNNVTIGVGTTYKNKLGILFLYTTNTAVVQNYSNGEFELGLKYNFR